MIKKTLQIQTVSHIVALIVFLVFCDGNLHGAEGKRGHGNPGDVIVTVDGDPVTRGDIMRRIRSAKGDIDPSKMDPNEWQKIVQTATKSEIIDKLLLKAARSENMVIDSEKLEVSVNQTKERLGEERFQQILQAKYETEEDFKAYVNEKMLIEKYKLKLFEDITVEETEVESYYEENKNILTMPERVHLELLSTDKKVDADALYKRIKGGVDFEKVALVNDINEIKSIERGTRWLPYGAMPAEIQPRMKKGKTGDILEPFLVKNKYYIMKILEKRPAGSVGFDEVEDSIRERLRKDKENMTLVSWYESRVREAKIEYIN